MVHYFFFRSEGFEDVCLPKTELKWIDCGTPLSPSTSQGPPFYTSAREMSEKQVGWGRQDDLQDQAQQARLERPALGQECVSPYFELELVDVEQNVKFNFTTEEFVLRLNDLGEAAVGSNLPLLLRNVLTNVITLLKPLNIDAERSSLRIVLNTDSLENPVSVPFMHHSELTADVLLAFLEGQSQSNEKFDITQPLYISMQHTTSKVTGSGWWSTKGPRTRTVLDLNDWCSQKKSVLRIINSDQICLARALVVGMALADKNANPGSKVHLDRYNSIRQAAGASQGREARTLHVSAGVPLGPCGLEELTIFQELFKVQSCCIQR